ncbi:MAG: hypothetical protein SPH93_02410 [Clostridium sp.]|jgi:hypothetical protein|uniref:hypothetical protein n=1 Tax=Clostridium sp. TaxID=1506 RepID=UPI0025BFFA80|nr:hypothetical protein [Clostridium sp.]MDY6226524.1 hypothetical protein [Clostridium sp.]
MKSKKINLIIGGLIIVLVGGLASFKYISNKKSSEKVASMIEENTTKENKDESKLEDEKNKEDKITEEKENENENNSNGIEVPEGFKTSIASGNTDQEIIKNNNLLEKSKFSIYERLKAKNVAENFIQAIERFDKDKIKEQLELITKYVADDKKEELENLYGYTGRTTDKIKSIITNVKSIEVRNEYDNDYILLDVYVRCDVVDGYNQVSNRTNEGYRVKLLKINNEYKVVEYLVN